MGPTDLSHGGGWVGHPYPVPPPYVVVASWRQGLTRPSQLCTVAAGIRLPTRSSSKTRLSTHVDISKKGRPAGGCRTSGRADEGGEFLPASVSPTIRGL